ncbi:MAG: hypothetical protein ACREBD_22620 [Blastocatellia bacterium]
MPINQLQCPKCRSQMEEGFIADHADGNATTISEWVEGPPDKRWWGLKTGGKEKLRVVTFRCVRCGYLESYAPIPTE